MHGLPSLLGKMEAQRPTGLHLNLGRNQMLWMRDKLSAGKVRSDLDSYQQTIGAGTAECELESMVTTLTVLHCGCVVVIA